MSRYVCIHGHFYQPPRENPWLEEVEQQDSAAPYHDWNERVTAECYAPNTASRIVGGDGRILDIVNNFSRISFNVGPTLFAWLERHQPSVASAIVEADRLSRERFSGHGSAMAQVYNHMIMPLANRRDKHTQAWWGIADFEKRFGRYPEGMWLPETAVDVETLEVLAELKIRFTVLAPRQARRVRAIGRASRWHETKGNVDPRVPYLCRLPSGKSIALFFYDGPVSQDLAFGGLLRDGSAFAHRLLAALGDGDGPRLAHVATDGESYGHHHRYGEMALSWCLHTIDSAPDVRLTNYGEFLELHPPAHEAEIWEDSSWSCVHGVERWRENCGCSGGHPGWTQAWRRPLREALDELRDAVLPLWEESAGALLHDPWGARNDYIEAVGDRSRENIARFLARHAARELSPEENVRALKLLELQRNCMLMYTSCGWFFDEISGIETTQVLRYASEAMQFAFELFDRDFETPFLERLAQAPSNTLGDGRKVYEAYVKTNRLDLLRVAAHHAISSLFSEGRPPGSLYCYSLDSEAHRVLKEGKARLVIGRTRVTSDQTWEFSVVSYAALHLGDQNVSGGVRPFMGAEAFDQMEREIAAEFERGQPAAVLQLMVKHFGGNNYTVWHLFRDEQRRVLDIVLADTMAVAGAALRRIADESGGLMNLLRALGHAVPSEILSAVTYVVNDDLRAELRKGLPDPARLESLVRHADRWSLRLDEGTLNFLLGAWISARLDALRTSPTDTGAMEGVVRVLELLEPLRLDPDLWRAQNAWFAIGRDVLPGMRSRAESGDAGAARWMEAFARLGERLRASAG